MVDIIKQRENKIESLKEELLKQSSEKLVRSKIMSEISITQAKINGYIKKQKYLLEIEKMLGEINSFKKRTAFNGLFDYEFLMYDWTNSYDFNNPRDPMRESYTYRTREEDERKRGVQYKEVFELMGGTGSGDWCRVTIKGNIFAIYFYAKTAVGSCVYENPSNPLSGGSFDLLEYIESKLIKKHSIDDYNKINKIIAFVEENLI